MVTAGGFNQSEVVEAGCNPCTGTKPLGHVKSLLVEVLGRAPVAVAAAQEPEVGQGAGELQVEPEPAGKPSAFLSIAPRARVRVMHDGRQLRGDLTVAQAGLGPLDRVDVVAEDEP